MEFLEGLGFCVVNFVTPEGKSPTFGSLIMQRGITTFKYNCSFFSLFLFCTCLGRRETMMGSRGEKTAGENLENTGLLFCWSVHFGDQFFEFLLAGGGSVGNPSLLL